MQGFREAFGWGWDSDCDSVISKIGKVSRHFQPSRKRKVRSRGRVLDLFSGTGSVGKRLTELGYEVVYLDINPKYSPPL